MKYHTLSFSKIRKDVEKFVSVAVTIGALRDNNVFVPIVADRKHASTY